MSERTRGFASMPTDQQRAIARKGGRAAHAKGVGHEWTSEEARAAGRKGGAARHRRQPQPSPPPSPAPVSHEEDRRGE